MCNHGNNYLSVVCFIMYTPALNAARLVGIYIIPFIRPLICCMFFGCQLDEPYGFPDDHQQNAAMFQCHVNTGIYKMFFYSCIIVVFCRK